MVCSADNTYTIYSTVVPRRDNSQRVSKKKRRVSNPFNPFSNFIEKGLRFFKMRYIKEVMFNFHSDALRMATAQ